MLIVISHREFWLPLRSVERNHLCNFGRGHFRDNSVKLFGPAVQEMSFKDISYLELWMPFSSAERTIWAVFMPPTLKKLRGILLWAFPSVHYKFKIGFKNFIDAFLIKK